MHTTLGACPIGLCDTGQKKEDRTGPDVLPPGTGPDIIPRPVIKRPVLFFLLLLMWAVDRRRRQRKGNACQKKLTPSFKVNCKAAVDQKTAAGKR